MRRWQAPIGVTSLVAGLLAHVITTTAWVLVRNLSDGTLLDLPIRVVSSTLLAPYLVLIYAGLGGGWLFVGRRLRWPLETAWGRVLWLVALPPFFAAAAFLARAVISGELVAVEVSLVDLLLYFVLAPLSFGAVALALLREH